MPPSRPSAQDAATLVASAEVVEFLAARRTPRGRATRKLLDVVGRLTDGAPPLDKARTAWVHGSYARGASDVGDIDVILEVDESRSEQQQALDSYYRRAHPYAEVVSALGCGGASVVSLDVFPVFAGAPKPISPERAAERLPAGYAVPRTPRVVHTVTGDPFEPEPQLLWVRGDAVEDAEARLDKLGEDPEARRFERTTTVPLIDELLGVLGVETAFPLAAQLRAGNLAVNAVVLSPAEPPPAAARALSRRYAEGSTRKAAVAAALAYLRDDGVALDEVDLVDAPVIRESSRRASRRRSAVNVDFNAFRLYLLASGSYRDGYRHLHVWPSGRKGRWLGLDVLLVDAEATRELSHAISGHPYAEDYGKTRYDGIRLALGMPPLSGSSG